MWFEILPSFGIISVAMSLPSLLTYFLHKGTLGNAYRRNLDERFDRVMYLRDRRLTDNPYIMNVCFLSNKSVSKTGSLRLSVIENK